MNLALEDNFSDVIGKAQRGLGLSDSALVAKAGISGAQLQGVRAERYDAPTLRALASVLGLKANALCALPQYHPAAVEVPGLAAFTTSYGSMLVNAYLAWDPATKDAAVFDTGTDCLPILDFLRTQGLTLRFIFLTHTHGDHVADLDRLTSSTGAPVFVSSREECRGAQPFDPGRKFQCGGLRIGTRLTWGHSRGGTTYVIEGLSHPVAVVGDAMFAGSMGGGSVSYADALKTNRAQILTLPPETVLCPGHGPLTTVAEELENNPFFP